MSRSEMVNALVIDCLFKQGEVVEERIIAVSGIVRNFGFDRDKVEKNKPKIRELLTGFPKEFYKNTGGGWSFLNFCILENGEQWGEHQAMDELICLGIAAGYVKFCMPREYWSVLPGGMPYLVIDLEATWPDRKYLRLLSW